MGHASMTVTDQNFQTEVLQSDKPVLVDFWAEWCGPCRAVGPVIEELAAEQKAVLKVGKLDVDANGQTAMQYNVMSIPTMILYVNGQEVKRLVGAMPKDRILAQIQGYLATPASA